MPRRPRRETRAERTIRLHGTLVCSQCRAPWQGTERGHADGCDPTKRGIHSLWDVLRMAHAAGQHAAAPVADCPLCPRRPTRTRWT